MTKEEGPRGPEVTIAGITYSPKHKLCARCKKSSQCVPFRTYRRETAIYYTSYCNICSAFLWQERWDSGYYSTLNEERRRKRAERIKSRPTDQDFEFLNNLVFSNIKRLKEAGWSLRRICRESDIDRASLWRWNHGRVPQKEVLAKIAPIIVTLGRKRNGRD